MRFGLLSLFGAALLASASVPAVAGPSGALDARPSVNAGTGLIGPGDTIDLAPGAQLHLPLGLDPAQPTPLLILFPGRLGDARQMLDALRGSAERRGFAMLAFSPDGPDFDAVDDMMEGIGSARADMTATWPRPLFGNDLKRLDAALAAAFVRLNVDPDHIGLFGFSHGANYALMVGTANPQLFATIAAISPDRLVIPRKTKGGQSIFLAHGRVDEHKSFRETACRTAPRLTKLGNAVHFEAFDGGHELPDPIREPVLDHFMAGRSAEGLAALSPGDGC